MMFAVESFFVDILYLQFRLRKSTLYPQCFFFFKVNFDFYLLDDDFYQLIFLHMLKCFGIFFSLIFVTLVFKC